MDQVGQGHPTVRWEAHGPADGATARTLNLRVDDWIADTLDVDDVRRSDMLLTVAEALANAAEHAYSSSADAGEMNVAIAYDDADTGIVIQISDRGTWLKHASGPTDTSRGRGLLLMRALADDVTLDSNPEGTRVQLHFRTPQPATRRPAPSRARG